VVNRSELYHGQTRDSLEIAEVQRRDFVAKVQRRRADQQILERKLDAYRFPLALDASCYMTAAKAKAIRTAVVCPSRDSFRGFGCLQFAREPS
jgi:hypothetical protein